MFSMDPTREIPSYAVTMQFRLRIANRQNAHVGGAVGQVGIDLGKRFWDIWGTLNFT